MAPETLYIPALNRRERMRCIHTQRYAGRAHADPPPIPCMWLSWVSLPSQCRREWRVAAMVCPCSYGPPVASILVWSSNTKHKVRERGKCQFSLNLGRYKHTVPTHIQFLLDNVFVKSILASTANITVASGPTSPPTVKGLTWKVSVVLHWNI